MNSYKSALNKLKRNKISIKDEIVSTKDALKFKGHGMSGSILFA